MKSIKGCPNKRQRQHFWVCLSPSLTSPGHSICVVHFCFAQVLLFAPKTVFMLSKSNLCFLLNMCTFLLKCYCQHLINMPLQLNIHSFAPTFFCPRQIILRTNKWILTLNSLIVLLVLVWLKCSDLQRFQVSRLKNWTDRNNDGNCYVEWNYK